MENRTFICQKCQAYDIELVPWGAKLFLKCLSCGFTWNEVLETPLT